jgi:hypothetical protein
MTWVILSTSIPGRAPAAFVLWGLFKARSARTD